MCTPARGRILLAVPVATWRAGVYLEAVMTISKGVATRVVRGSAAVVAVCAGSVLYGRWVRGRLLTWGASGDETTRVWPGDELIPDANAPDCTMATTLPAPPERVWPWLVQMGVGRAGWYSWDSLDNGGKPSANHIVPEWQDLRVGQRLEVSTDGQRWMTVAVVEPDHALVLRATVELPSGRSFEPRPDDLPRAYLDGIWGFYLEPAPGDKTRLVRHTRGHTHLGPLAGPFGRLVGEPAHFIMQTRQFHILRTRVGAGG
jgi:proline iminopeptidase